MQSCFIIFYKEYKYFGLDTATIAV